MKEKNIKDIYEALKENTDHAYKEYVNSGSVFYLLKYISIPITIGNYDEFLIKKYPDNGSTIYTLYGVEISKSFFGKIKRKYTKIITVECIFNTQWRGVEPEYRIL